MLYSTTTVDRPFRSRRVCSMPPSKSAKLINNEKKYIYSLPPFCVVHLNPEFRIWIASDWRRRSLSRLPHQVNSMPPISRTTGDDIVSLPLTVRTSVARNMTMQDSADFKISCRIKDVGKEEENSRNSSIACDDLAPARILPAAKNISAIDVYEIKEY